jgi:hypothetical protein
VPTDYIPAKNVLVNVELVTIEATEFGPKVVKFTASRTWEGHNGPTTKGNKPHGKADVPKPHPNLTDTSQSMHEAVVSG